MKKLIILTCFLAISFCFTSCGDSFESDVKKVADLQCKIKLLSKDKETQYSSETSQMKKELKELISQMREKYSEREDYRKFKEEVILLVKECK